MSRPQRDEGGGLQPQLAFPLAASRRVSRIELHSRDRFGMDWIRAAGLLWLPGRRIWQIVVLPSGPPCPCPRIGIGCAPEPGVGAEPKSRRNLNDVREATLGDKTEDFCVSQCEGIHILGGTKLNVVSRLFCLSFSRSQYQGCAKESKKIGEMPFPEKEVDMIRDVRKDPPTCFS